MINKKKRFMVYILALCLAILGGVGYYYFSVYLSPKNVITRSFTKIINTNKGLFNNPGEDLFKQDNITLDGKLSFDIKDTTSSLESSLYIALINKLNLNYSLNKKSQEEILWNYDLKNSSTSVLKGKFYTNKDQIYYYIDGFKNQYIKTDSLKIQGEDYSWLNQSDKIIKVAINSLENALEPKYFSKSKDNGQQRYTLSLTKEDLTTITNKVKEDLTNNREIDDSFKKILEDKTDPTIDALTIDVYADALTGKFNKIKVLIKKDNKDINICYELQNNQDVVTISTGDTILYTVVIQRTNGSMNYTVKNEKNEEIVTLKKEDKEGNTDYTLEVHIKGITYTIQIKIYAKNQNYRVSHNLKIQNGNDVLIEGTINNQFTVKGETTINENISHAITLTNEDKSELSNYLMQQLYSLFS